MFVSIKDLAFDEYARVTVLDEELLREIVGGTTSESVSAQEIDSPMNCGIGCGGGCC